MSVLMIKKLSYKDIFDKLDLDINKGSNITILGSSGSGKSTLARMIRDGHHKIMVSGNVVMIDSSVNDYIVGKTVREQLHFHMNINHYSDRKQANRIKKIKKLFDVETLLDIDPFYLSMGMKQLIIILSYLVLDFDILVLDNAFCYLDSINKQKIFQYLKQLKKITIVNFTNNAEDTLLSKEVAILNKKIVYREKIEYAFNSDKLYISNGLDLPFLGDLCLKLKYYEMIDKTILNMKELVDEIWT